MKHLLALNQFFWKYRLRFLLGLVFIILTNYFRILSPQLTGYVVNTVVHAIDSKTLVQTITPIDKGYNFAVVEIIYWLNKKLPAERIGWAALILLGLALLSGFFMFLMRQSIIVMSRLIEFSQKNQVYNHYQKLDLNFYKSHSTGDLMNRISEDISRVRMFTGPAIMYFINLAAILGFSIYFMVQTSPKLTIIALCPLPILVIVIYLVNTIINKKSEQIQSLLSDLTTNAQESYSGIRIIKSYVQEKAMLGFFTKNSEAYKKHALSLAKTEAIYFPSMALMIGISTLLTIMVGAWDVLHDPTHHKVGTIAEFVMYIQMLTFPVSAIGWTASITQRAAASQKRINEFLDTKPSIENVSDAIQNPIYGNIEFKKVNFTYPHSNIKGINDFSLNIKKGEKVAIVGRTGSGKSTLAQLILRMYDNDSGEILIDQVPVNLYQLAHLRSSIAYVPQDVFLFSETVAHNISFGKDDATQTDIIAAAQKAAIHQEIEGFANGYETLIGERGVTLSGGQKQRISIARAFIKNPSIIIFDDCLSAVDARTENAIISSLNSFLIDKTALIITHRIFSLLNFDKIIVLENGTIVEQGTHDQLLNLNGYYAEMYNRQQLQEKLPEL
jgi:ATP-binding cassette subfamily B protein